MTHDIMGWAGDVALSLLVAGIAALIVGSILWGFYRGD